MRLSYVIVTHNRRERLLRTLSELEAVTPLPRGAWEVRVVDNASTDGTAEALRDRSHRFPVHLHERPSNEGVAARNHGIDAARGAYVCLLDDDSYPVGDAIPRSLARLDAQGDLAGVVGRVRLPDGGLEACALPGVLISCAVVLRRAALERVGGFREEFFRKAGEYDLSYRLWDAGWRLARCEDVVYRHDKHLAGRSSSLAHKLDLRNNLILVERYLPRAMRSVYRRDTLRRYVAVARQHGELDAAREACAEARRWAKRERLRGRPEVLRRETLETIFAWRAQAAAVTRWAGELPGRRVAIAGYAKNLYATRRACRLAGLDVAAILDDAPAFRGMRYRGTPVLELDAAAALRLDGVVLANVNPAQVEAQTRHVAARFAGPILQLWTPTFAASSAAPDTHPAATIQREAA